MNETIERYYRRLAKELHKPIFIIGNKINGTEVNPDQLTEEAERAVRRGIK